MSPTLLIDLDDTLLTNDIETFLPAYLQALSRELAPFAEPQKLITALMAATGEMVRNHRPDCTLQEIFDAFFYPALQLDKDDLQEPIERFYAEVFPTLQALTQPRPSAVRMVEEAFGRGFKIAIATNPLFPKTAILQRLAWAGLPADRYPFDLVASYETFHFAKPQPAFFAEVLARLGWPDGPIVAIGDKLDNDIAPARQLGLATFWIQDQSQGVVEGPATPSGGGSISDFLSWLKNFPSETLQPEYNLPSAMLATLRSTPAALDTLCGDLNFTTWETRPQPEEWCTTEVLCHLRDVDKEVNLPRLQKVLQETNPFLPGKDTDPWAKERLYICQSGLQALHKFTATRLELLDLLDGMPADGWQRPARHAIFGPTHLAELVSFIAGHDRLHVQQIIQTLETIQD